MVKKKKRTGRFDLSFCFLVRDVARDSDAKMLLLAVSAVASGSHRRHVYSAPSLHLANTAAVPSLWMTPRVRNRDDHKRKTRLILLPTLVFLSGLTSAATASLLRLGLLVTGSSRWRRPLEASRRLRITLKKQKQNYKLVF